MRDVEHPSDARQFDTTQFRGAGKDFAELTFGQLTVRTDERQRYLAVVGGVHRMPELQVRRTPVEDQQPVSAAGDGGARDQVVVVGRGRIQWGLVGCVERRRGPRGVGGVVRRRPLTHWMSRLAGDVGLEGVRRRAGDSGGRAALGPGYARGVISHRWSFPGPYSGNLCRRAAPHDLRTWPQV